MKNCLESVSKKYIYNIKHNFYKFAKNTTWYMYIILFKKNFLQTWFLYHCKNVNQLILIKWLFLLFWITIILRKICTSTPHAKTICTKISKGSLNQIHRYWASKVEKGE